MIFNRTCWGLGGFLTWIAIGVALSTGCQEPSQPVVQETTAATTPKVSSPAAPIDPSSPTGQGTQQEVQEDKSAEISSTDEEPSIDSALQKLKEQEVQDPRQPAALPPQEVHAALLPMVEDHWVRLNPAYEVWIDTKGQQVIVGGRISLREGLLEMFACPRGTKEHESIVAAVSNAETVHVGLLGVGAIKGIPGYWTEETGVVTAKGPVCQITVVWQAGEQQEDRQEVNAKEMVMDLATGQALTHDWVFCGSRVWVDPEDPSYREYQADWGDMICVSNFPTAMIDLNVESSNSNASLSFTANPEKVPPLGQPVLMFIKPDLTTNPAEAEIAAAEKERDAHEARLEAELEARMKARESENEAATTEESDKKEKLPADDGDG